MSIVSKLLIRVGSFLDFIIPEFKEPDKDCHNCSHFYDGEIIVDYPCTQCVDYGLFGLATPHYKHWTPLK